MLRRLKCTECYLYGDDRESHGGAELRVLTRRRLVWAYSGHGAALREYPALCPAV
jgi:hypothetical protein